MPPNSQSEENVEPVIGPPSPVEEESSLIYESSPKHGSQARGNVSALPTNGQEVLNNSIQVSPNSSRRVGIDRTNREFVVFHETHPGTGIFHGFSVSWNNLRPVMRNVLINSGQVNRRGKIQ